MCERNTGYEAGSINEVLRRVDHKNIAVRERSDRDFGWWTTNNMKMGYGTTARKALGLKSVRFMDGWVCCASHGDNKLRSEDEVRTATKDEFIMQLGNVRAINKLATDPASHNRTVLSGKAGDDGKVRKDQDDDLFITFGMCCFIIPLYQRGRLPNFPHRQVRQSYGGGNGPAVA